MMLYFSCYHRRRRRNPVFERVESCASHVSLAVGPVRTDELFTIIYYNNINGGGGGARVPQKDPCARLLCVRALIVVSKPRTPSSFGDFNNWFYPAEPVIILLYILTRS